MASIERALPIASNDFRTLGIIAWALDYFPGRSAHFLERKAAATLRKRALAPLIERRPPPPAPGPRDPDWTGALGGTFLMGTLPAEGRDADERPVHEVRLSPFRMLVRPVTAREFGFSSLRRKLSGLPAIDLDWYSAYAYAAWRGGRLPTEAEWEFAARGGTEHDYSDRGGRPATIERVAWYGANSDQRLRPVMQLEPNPWGLYDMSGSVWEWVADWFGRYPEDRQIDPWGPFSGAGRVLRGGSIWDDARSAHVAFRSNWFPGFGFVDIGFRIVLPGG
ncbi:MAG TPA: SUMF1/EgtB/PvdO family nonheme iron enzyme [Thermoanaerobaculia bacterium]|nr:SUMF1/EgtB/PvdO family nonheme iron enzyme [Thermoanaerobaculia bacterium]